MLFDLHLVMHCYEAFISLIGWMRTHQAKLCSLTVKKNYASILYRTFYQMTFRIVICIHLVGHLCRMHWRCAWSMGLLNVNVTDWLW